MKDQNAYIHRLIVLFLSFFGIGFIPKAPGTLGSLATIPLLFLFHYFQFSLMTLIFIIVALLILSIWACEKIQQEKKLHDPQWIVIDEVLGMMLTWMFLRSILVPQIILVFISFRVFDIIKIWPASFFDKKVHHGAGTILDDIVSALYAGSLSYFIDYYFLR